MIDLVLWLIGAIFLLIGCYMERKDAMSGIPIPCYGITSGLFISAVLVSINEWIG